VRLIPTAGQHGDGPQASALIEGLAGVGHVIADAACDAGRLRTLTGHGLGARAHIAANPSRAIEPSIPTSTQRGTTWRIAFRGSNASAASPCAARRPPPAS
jgi:transposase